MTIRISEPFDATTGFTAPATGRTTATPGSAHPRRAGSAGPPDAAVAAIRRRAAGLGLAPVGIAPARLAAGAGERYREALAQGHHGTMDWLAREPERRASPDQLWPEARTTIVCGLNYAPAADPLPELELADRGYLSVYARHRDYHDVLKGRLKDLAGWIAARFGAKVKVLVDTAPVLEKPLAQAAGLGWQGKHTNLVSRAFGSWLFLGEILTDLALPIDEPEADRCGRCRRCLEVCPTDAFPAPYRLDARRCISYLTIEYKGSIPRELRPLMGNRIYGCDDCLAVCPWNKFARKATEAKLHARADLTAPALAELAALDDAAFRQRFSGSPVKRIGRDRFVRNVLIAIGNSGEPALASVAERLLIDSAALVRATAVWALARLAEPARLRKLLADHAAAESDRDVIDECRSALDKLAAAG
jgi:epoxyqueuosine reductase